MSNTEQIDHHLSGNYAPVRKELNLPSLEIQGAIPSSLIGTYYYIGPNPQFDPVGDYFWFTGDGMVHAISISPKNASYKNCWVRTDKFKAERKLGAPIFDGMDRRINKDPAYANLSNNSANTNIIKHAGMLQALNEGALPILMHAKDLSTIGLYNYGTKNCETLSAHPRIEQSTGLLHSYSYLSNSELLNYYCINTQGKITAQQQINWPYACMMHDFVITKNFCVFPCFPVTYNIQRMMTSGEFFKWEPQLPAVFGIMSRTDTNTEIIWVELDACQVMHFSNAYEQGNTIIIDAFKYTESPLFYSSATDEPLLTQLVRWEINLSNKSIKETKIHQCRGEFPRFDERFNGRSYRYCYYAEDEGNKKYLNRLNKIDFETGNQQSYHLGNDGITEPVFVPKNQLAKEGEGYLLMMHYCHASTKSCLDIFDAQKISNGPIASIKLPCRVPYGFHGNWVAKAE